MKKHLFLLFSAIACCFLFSCGKSSKNQKSSWMKDQSDQTDTYAIPLDTSEEEEKAEERALRKMDKSLPKCTPDGKCSAK